MVELIKVKVVYYNFGIVLLNLDEFCAYLDIGNTKARELFHEIPKESSEINRDRKAITW